MSQLRRLRRLRRLRPFRSLAIACFLAVLFTLTVPPPSALAVEPGTAEVFDVDRGEVVRLIPNTPELQHDVEAWIYASKGAAPQFRLDPENGIGLKLAFTPPLRVEDDRWDGWIQGTILEAIVFVSRSPTYPPTLLLLKSNGRIAALHIPEDVEPFLQKYGLDSEGLYTGRGPT
ncbi:hypothetical protein MO973_01750 [Paenibacillus sp. TRM 82003]|nr:hypothetical protein [Paenibacillus sp. TRM 82003]